MAEPDFDPNEEGRRIAANYLNKLNWARQWRQTLSQQTVSAARSEELEAQLYRCDQISEEAEENFSSEYEHWRKDGSPQAKLVLHKIFEMLGRRHDLGFFGQRIIERLRRELS